MIIRADFYERGADGVYSIYSTRRVRLISTGVR